MIYFVKFKFIIKLNNLSFIFKIQNILFHSLSIFIILSKF